MSDSRDLVLYYRPTCPFCVRVTNFIDRNGIQVKLRNISKDPQAAAPLSRSAASSRSRASSSTESRSTSPVT